MAIKIGQTTTDPAVARYFSGKRTDIKVFLPRQLADESDFCTCIKQCVRALPAFTDEVGTDFYKNDKYAEFMNVITGGSIVCTLIKNGNQETAITDNTYGVFTSVTNTYFRFEIDFYKVWDGLGYGTYELNIKNLNVSGSVVSEITSPKFNLMKFSEKAANNTFRIETKQSGVLKHGKKYINLKNDDTVSQQIRMYGGLVFSGNVIENDSLQLNNNERSQVQIKDQAFPEYELTIQLASSAQVNPVLLDYLFAQEVKISDYSVYNFVHDPREPSAVFYRSLPVKRTGTEFNASRTNKRKTIKIPLEYDYKNVFKIN